MAKRHGGLGRGLDALIPKREEVEEAMRISDAAGVEVLFSDDEDDNNNEALFEPDEIQATSQNDSHGEKKDDVSRETSHNSLHDVSREDAGNISSDSGDITNSAKTSEVDHPRLSVSGNTSDNKIRKEVKTVRISEIEPNRGQPRKHFDEAKLEELADSISKYGLLQPILVQDCGDHYEIIAGERRWRASLKAGLKEVPVIVRNYSDREILELSLIENIQRENLNPIEEAKAYKQLIDEFGLTQEEVAERVSKSRSAVTNAVRLLKLSDDVQKMVVDGKLSMGHARALISVDNMDDQTKLANKIYDERLSVRAAEKEVREYQKGKDRGSSEKGQQDSAESDRSDESSGEKDRGVDLIYKEIEERLKQSLHTKVAITRRRNGHGKIQIEFYNNDDLEKIIERLASES